MTSDDHGLRLACPGSKSMTQRALILAALADGPCELRGALECDDSRYLSAALRQLGVDVRWRDDRVDVSPPGALVAGGKVLYCGNAGTAARFSACLSLVAEGGMVIDGDSRMTERPIGDLGDALEELGIAVTYLGRPRCPPVRLERVRGGLEHVSLPSGVSSQYASGLLMVASRLAGGLTITLEGRPVSRPYLEMTIAMMRRLGGRASWLEESRIRVEPDAYKGAALEVEPDWSAASFLLAASRVLGLPVQIPGLLAPGVSLQGDAAFAAFLDELRADRMHTFDLTDTPDLIAPLVAVALFAEHPTVIQGAQHTRYKECDRIHVLATELGRAGAEISERDDGLEVVPFKSGSIPCHEVWLDPANDHRMAMTFGVLSLRMSGIRVRDPECVAKSFPSFWGTLQRIRTAAGERADTR